MKNILCFGDSNTYGYMPGDGRRWPREQRWTGRLAALLGPGYYVIEEGMNGRTTAFEDALQPWRSGLGAVGAAMKSHAPLDLVVVMLGTNDAKHRYNVSADEIGMGMTALLQAAKNFFVCNAAHAGPAPQFLVVSPVPMPDTGGDPEFDAASLQKQAALAAVLRGVAAQQGAAFADAAQWVPQTLLGSDCCHFTAAAHERFAAQMAACVHRLLD